MAVVFDLSSHAYIWNTYQPNSYIIVKVVLPPNNKEIVFKFKVNCDDDDCDNIIKDAITSHWEYEEFDKYDPETGTINADLTEENLLIPLPDIDCEVTSTPAFAT